MAVPRRGATGFLVAACLLAAWCISEQSTFVSAGMPRVQRAGVLRVQMGAAP
eukprot:CAMPEP_0195058672 /NCGR_PEP_ID=MMETSP0448-20130528/6412_1 /TAXON_ID=66468 /ORGANISM="Heterocapsa triquestra, Strain CCMP 448" /LENGTH=51 /DNA_ID=CAMNT_0040088833 /DNA_START=70 /DNA_END=222 /DNA_ORIENTATION=-